MKYIKDPHRSQVVSEAAAKKAGLALRFHDLRHVFASRMLAAGANLVEVASQTGHSDMTMARRYSHATKDRVRDIMDRASDLDLGG